MGQLSILIIVTLASTLIIWLPHLLNLKSFLGLNFGNGVATIYRNFDGLEYVVIAKTFYKPELIASIPQALPTNYYAAHFPGYSLAILLFAPLFGFLKSMIFVSLLFTIASVIAFFFLVKDFRLSQKPLTLSLIFLLLPARWVIVRSVGSAEPMFIFFVILSIYFFLKFEAINKTKFIWAASLFGSLAQLTRPPGILLFAALVLYLLIFKRPLKTFIKFFPLILIPLTLVIIFFWYQNSYHDFFAYFHSGDNIHLTFLPFPVFNKNQFWVGDIWLEDIVYIYILGFLAVVYLFKEKLYPLALFSLTYLIASSFVAHRDISRYALPIFPFVLIAFERVLTSKEFRIILPIIALAIYLYSQNFLLANIAPIPNLANFN